MINDLINGISKKLHNAFGYKIYKENIKQGLVEPCFSIVVLEVEETAQLPNRYFRQYPFDIHYFSKNGKAECYAVAEKLLIELEQINVLDNVVQGSKIKYEIVDDVLHFFVNYNLFIKKETVKVNAMDAININSKVRD